ncbi:MULTISPECIES: bile acid:sodium symporter family protein [unclassified Vibrio]|uniref:Bile acid:sodium symporter family protein n=1 Tax=Vibrio sp. HB236076 TaxID=3232307 RepID=A0AB39H9E3_9VIBR|nr:bile acid:sodium symporter family protein [Vibrio sp. HB161653]MDP5254105.1 bile acid:sodium symporter family protein [Vibrio sp. HB161653]
MLNFITQLFPLWAVLLSFIAYQQPQLFVPLKSQIVPLLTVIMLAMGLTLTPKDFTNVVRHRWAIVAGLFLQFSIMPLAALFVSFLFHFDSALTVGMVLVGSVAGGTSSNVMCYLAKGDVALSISMTAVSTLLGVVLTPLLVEIFAGQTVDVPMWSMLASLVKIVLLPVAIGVFANVFLRPLTQVISPILPLISMVAIVVIIAIVVALNQSNIQQIGLIVALAVIVHNGMGLFMGYWICRCLGFSQQVCRTIAFEVGLQNSGLATALAMKFFTPVSAVPGTLFSIWHNLSGSTLAGIWSKKPASSEQK